MAKPGPKTLPANVHRLSGNRSKLSVLELRDRDAVLPAVSIPKAPSHLLPAAKKEWKRVSVHLEKLGLITELDMAALAAYCQAYARWTGAELKLKKLGEDGLITKTPSGYQQMSVWYQVSNKAVEQMHKFSAEFGMTPSTRTRVTASPQLDLFPNDSKPENKAGQFFNS
jgi:P27 family predicted phage terminase small subunit